MSVCLRCISVHKRESKSNWRGNDRHNKPPVTNIHTYTLHRHSRSIHTLYWIPVEQLNVYRVRCSFVLLFSLSHFFVISAACSFIQSFEAKPHRHYISWGLMFVNKSNTNSVAFWSACATHRFFDGINSFFLLPSQYIRNFLCEWERDFFTLFLACIQQTQFDVVPLQYPITSI